MASELDKAIEALGEQMKNIVVKALTVEDVRMQKTSSIDFQSNGESGVYGLGIKWNGDGATRQFIYRANPDRIWTSESIDLKQDASFMIGNSSVLSKNELGSSVRLSSLVKVGTLQNLRTQGNLVIDDYIYWNSNEERFGIGTDTPNATFSVVSLESEFIVDVENQASRIGNFTTDNLEIITDNTARITVSASGSIKLGSDVESKVSVPGKLGVGIANPPTDASITTAGPIRFEGKKFEVGDREPQSGVYSKGDIVWNSDPRPTAFVGWVCTREGTPGEWKPFGQIV
jgi:hypothetical protein